MVVNRFRKFTAALRQQQAGAVERVGRLVERGDGLMLASFARYGAGTSGAQCDVCLQSRAGCGIQFIAGVEDGQRFDFFAADDHRVARILAHNNSSSCARSLRVARNNEFFTVSSVVPRASPMARNFRP